jgi:SAM-dependent methyltransferase
MFDDASQDFVIASHVFEHLANPLAMLVESHRVLKPGGVLLLLLPDRRMTSDVSRPPTTLEHLVAEYHADVREVDDAHLLEYVRLVQRYDGEDPDKDAELLATARMRSVHVHCWTEDSWFPVVEYAVDELGCSFDLVELVLAGDIPGSKEFGYVLRRTPEPASPAEDLARLVGTRDLMMQTRFAQGELATRKAVQERDRQISQLKARLEEREALIARMRKVPGAVTLYRAGRRARARIAWRRPG